MEAYRRSDAGNRPLYEQPAVRRRGLSKTKKTPTVAAVSKIDKRPLSGYITFVQEEHSRMQALGLATTTGEIAAKWSRMSPVEKAVYNDRAAATFAAEEAAVLASRKAPVRSAKKQRRLLETEHEGSEYDDTSAHYYPHYAYQRFHYEQQHYYQKLHHEPRYSGVVEHVAALQPMASTEAHNQPRSEDECMLDKLLSILDEGRGDDDFAADILAPEVTPPGLVGI